MANLQKRGENTPAYPIQPSRQYFGNDGRWSTFLVDIGSPAQQFSTLISTSSLATWLVGSNACSTARDPTVAQHTDCYNLRGSTRNKGWQDADSKTYKAVGGYTLELNNDLPLGTVFGSSPVGYNYTGSVYNSNATLGRDGISLLDNNERGSSIVANDSLVYSVIDGSFWVSMVGIGHGTTQLDQDRSQFKSLLDIYANQSSIPSKSWGYTAGSYYNNTYGSLTLGGYDSARVEAPIADFKMDSFRGGKGVLQLMVAVQSISVEDSKSAITSVTKSGDTTTTFNAVIDSTIPYLYLPQTVCDKFASLLGLRYDNRTDLYLINATQRVANAGNKIHMVVSDTNNGLKTSKEIILPYAAFDLNMSWPIFDDPVSYFPIRRSVDNKAILGRTFLQEAFVIADFERGNFTVGRAVNAPNNLQNIVPIRSLLDKSDKSETNGISKGAIAGIVVGSVAATASVAVLIWLLFRRRRKHKAEAKAAAKQATDALKDEKKGLHDEGDGDDEYRPDHSRHVSELSGNSTLVGVRRKSALSGGVPTEALYEADSNEVIHEMEDKADTTAWTRAHRRSSDRAAVRYELDASSTAAAGPVTTPPIGTPAAAPVTPPPVSTPPTTTAAAAAAATNVTTPVSATPVSATAATSPDLYSRSPTAVSPESNHPSAAL